MHRTSTGIAYDRGGDPGSSIHVVLIHAGIADRRMWQPQWTSLADDMDLIRLDLRGFGDSTHVAGPTYAHPDDVLATMDEAGIERAHLVAASFGAGVAVEVALTAPQRVASLVLAPPGGSLLAEVTDDLQAFLDDEDAALEAGDLDTAVEANITSWLVGPGRTLGDLAPSVVRDVRRMQRRAFEAADALGDAEELELDPPPLDRLHEISAPTLVVVGGHDMDTSLDAAHRVSRGIPSATRVDWEDVAHLPSMEQASRFTRLLRAWLEEHREK